MNGDEIRNENNTSIEYWKNVLDKYIDKLREYRHELERKDTNANIEDFRKAYELLKEIYGILPKIPLSHELLPYTEILKNEIILLSNYAITIAKKILSDNIS